MIPVFNIADQLIND